MCPAQGARGEGLQSAAAALSDYEGAKEMAVEMRCRDAFQAVLLFERTHCLTLQVPRTSAMWLGIFY